MSKTSSPIFFSPYVTHADICSIHLSSLTPQAQIGGSSSGANEVPDKSVVTHSLRGLPAVQDNAEAQGVKPGTIEIGSGVPLFVYRFHSLDDRAS